MLSSATNHIVLVPADVRQIGDLVDATTFHDPACLQPSFWKEMMGFACCATALGRRIEEVLKKLIRKEGTRP